MQRSDASAQAELDAFVRFCAALTLDSGAPLVIEEYQRIILRDYFSGVVETLVLLPKKNGKTTLLAALALWHVLATNDAECVIGASSRDQATNLYRQATGFVARSEGLRARIAAKEGYRELRSLRDRGRARVLAADVDTADGVIPTLALVDELGRHKKPDLYGVFRDGLGPRDGQMLGISTAGDHEQTPLGLIRQAAYELPTLRRDGRYLYARSEDKSFALHEWALSDEDDLGDLDLVKQVNPASWQTIERLRRRRDSPSMLPWQWARFACGIWVSADSWWIRPDDWHAAATEETLVPGDRIALGFDGSRYGDATALVACRLDDGLVVPLGVWEAPRDGREWEVPASEVDAALDEAVNSYRVVRAYFDPPLWQSEIDNWAREYGEIIVRYPTNRTAFMAATERFRTDLLGGSVAHVLDEALTRHILNARIVAARGGYWLDKGSSVDRIDLAIATVLAYEARCDALAADAGRKEYAFL